MHVRLLPVAYRVEISKGVVVVLELKAGGLIDNQSVQRRFVLAQGHEAAGAA